MRSWKDLRTEFQQLRRNALTDARLDHTWRDSDGWDDWRLVPGTPADSRAIESLARMAGEKLLSVPAVSNMPRIVQELDPLKRWYHALALVMDVQTDLNYYTEQIGGGERITLFARIPDVCSCSADLCLRLEALSASPRPSLQVLLVAPRYAIVRNHWQAALATLSESEPEYRRAVHAAASAVEALARVLVGDPSTTLSAALTKLKGRVNPPLCVLLDKLWGYASDNARHAAKDTSDLPAHEAQFAIDVCEAALVMLIRADR